jgi:hypothetical protein
MKKPRFSDSKIFQILKDVTGHWKLTHFGQNY